MGLQGYSHYFSWEPGVLLRWTFPAAVEHPASFGTCPAAMWRSVEEPQQVLAPCEWTQRVSTSSAAKVRGYVERSGWGHLQSQS